MPPAPPPAAPAPVVPDPVTPDPLTPALAGEVPAGEALAPALFLHMPGSAGAGLLGALTGIYGERATRRLPRALPAEPAGGAALLHGPAPLHAWAPWRSRLRPFTLLRHPIARVQALYRATSAEPAAQLARWGLRPGFGVEEFLDSPHRGVIEHVANGMCRMLAADTGFTTPGGPGFDDPAARPALLAQAVAALGTLDFGLAEALPGSLALLAAAWGVPYRLQAAPPAEAPPGPEHDPAIVARIAAANTLDLALYDAAARLFRARLAALPPPCFRADPASLCHLRPGGWVDIAAIAGRQGFHPPDPHGVAWLDDAAEPTLHFRAPQAVARLALRLLAVGERYPLQRLHLRLDGRPLRVAELAAEGRWATLVSEPVDFSAPQMAGRDHALGLAAPYAVPARALDGDAADPRRLSVGLAKLRLVG